MRATILSIAIVLTGCSTSTVREYLDDETAATVSVSTDSWIFARERPDLAVNARDYVTVTPVQTNRGGQRTLYLYCQLWSTIDRRRDKSIVPSTAALALAADDRRFPLPSGAPDLRRLGFGRAPVEREHPGAEIRLAVIDIDALRFLSGANELKVTAAGDEMDYFLPWKIDRSPLLDFLHRVEATQR